MTSRTATRTDLPITPHDQTHVVLVLGRDGVRRLKAFAACTASTARGRRRHLDLAHFAVGWDAEPGHHVTTWASDAFVLARSGWERHPVPHADLPSHTSYPTDRTLGVNPDAGGVWTVHADDLVAALGTMPTRNQRVVVEFVEGFLRVRNRDGAITDLSAPCDGTKVLGTLRDVIPTVDQLSATVREGDRFNPDLFLRLAATSPSNLPVALRSRATGARFAPIAMLQGQVFDRQPGEEYVEDNDVVGVFMPVTRTRRQVART